MVIEGVNAPPNHSSGASGAQAKSLPITSVSCLKYKAIKLIICFSGSFNKWCGSADFYFSKFCQKKRYSDDILGKISTLNEWYRFTRVCALELTSQLTNHYIKKANGGQGEMKIHDVCTIFHILTPENATKVLIWVWE